MGSFILKTPMEASLKGLIIALENTHGEFYQPGEEVHGSLTVSTKFLGDCSTIASIAVCLKGEAQALWPERTVCGSFKESMVYLEVTQVVWRKENTPSGTLDSGLYVFAFSFLLRTEGLPNSVECECGSIQYTVCATIIKNKGLVQGPCLQSLPVEITVLNGLPFDNAKLTSPVVRQEEKTPCMSSGPVYLIAELPRSVYCVDKEEIPLVVKVINTSNRTVQRVRAKIVRCVVYSGSHDFLGQKRRRVERAIVRLSSADSVLPTRTLTWQPSPVTVPASERTVEGCDTISVEYHLVVVVSVCFTRSFLKVKLPLVLGSAPQCSSNSMSFQ